jgi:methylase of polypeptide subunit release factors
MDSYQNTFQTWDKLAKAYHDKFMEVNLYNDTYDLFCEHLKNKNATIFEIGCGPGNITSYILKKSPDYQIDATDVSSRMIELAKANNPKANFHVLDCRELDKISKKYDGIICGFCLPYLSKSDAEKLIKDAAQLLDTGSIFYLSAIEDDYSKSTLETSSDGQHTMHIYYHEERYLQDYLSKYNFETLAIIRKDYAKADGSTATHIIFIVKKY